MDYQSKWSKWADSQSVFWTLFVSVQFVDYQSKWSIQSEFSQEDKANEVRSEIIK